MSVVPAELISDYACIVANCKQHLLKDIKVKIVERSKCFVDSKDMIPVEFVRTIATNTRTRMRQA